MQIERCKGCQDLTAEEMLRFRSVEAAFQETSKSYGYSEVRTPTLEYLYLFTSAGTLTPGMLRRVYSFLDWDGWGGERVVLKPDATIPAARFYIDRLSQREQPARLSYVTNTFIFEETGTKARERWQCGAELIGAGSSMADVELVGMACDSVKKMGLNNIELKLSHAGLIRSILSGLGLSHSEQDTVFDRILDGEMEIINRMQAEKPQAVEAFKLLIGTKGSSAGFLKNLRALFAADIPGVQAALEDFIATIDLLEAMGVAYQIDFSSGKGFEYYTGFIFRLFAEGVNVGGGGRYDRLVGMMGGKDVPAGGFALYIDRLAHLINIDSVYVPVSQRIRLDVEFSAMKEAARMAELLRKAGWIVMFALQGTKAQNCGWEVEVRSSAPQLTVLNCGSGEKNVCESPEEVLVIVGCG
jgi:histidyl-tRNA synthetase